MSTMTIHLDTTNLIRDLEKVDERIRGEAALKAVTAGGHQVMNFARLNIREKLNRHPTGALWNSIDVVAKNDGEGAVAVVAPHRVYARIHEVGGMTGRGYRTKIPARPYMGPAVEDNIGTIITAMQAVIDKEIHW